MAFYILIVSRYRWFASWAPNVSQAVFAGLLNVPKVTAISWERGRRQPTGAALRLLDLVRKQPNILSSLG